MTKIKRVAKPAKQTKQVTKIIMATMFIRQTVLLSL